MSDLERNVCYEAFTKMCDKLREDGLLSDTEAQYWLYEKGFSAALDELLKIADTGQQARKFNSPRLQLLADKLLLATKK